MRPRRRTDEGYEKPEDSLAKTSRSSGDENAQKLLSNRGLIGDLTGTLDGSDRLKQKRAQIQPTLRLPMLRPQIVSVAASCTLQRRSGFAVGYGYRPDLNSRLLGIVRACSAQVIGGS